MPEDLPTPDKSYQQIKRETERRVRLEEQDRTGLWAQLKAPQSDKENG